MKFHQHQSVSEQIAEVPYARLLGIEAMSEAGCFRLPPRHSNVGNPLRPALHGGAIAGFMELSAMISVLQTSECERVPKVVDIGIDYLRSGAFVDTFARCRLNYLGRRMINVSVTAWQQDESKPIATARAQFLVKE